jgi:hypothetical protein
MKKIVLIIIVVLLSWLFVRFVIGGPEDDWICVNNEWIKHGNPSAPMPESGCGDQNINIKVISPAPNEIIRSPLELTGEARTWYFEGSFPVKILDANGSVLGNSYVTAQGDWMTTDFVVFKGEIDFTPSKTETGKIVFMKDNPSDRRELDESFELPIKFDMNGTQKLKIYFNNNNLDPEISCNKVFPVEREVYKTDAPARKALELLLKGPIQEEAQNSYLTSINPGVKIQKLTIENNVAKVDFDEQLEYQVGGSCRVSAISAQITQTLKQFPSVKSVIISINGRTEDILQP